MPPKFTFTVQKDGGSCESTKEQPATAFPGLMQAAFQHEGEVVVRWAPSRIVSALELHCLAGYVPESGSLFGNGLPEPVCWWADGSIVTLVFLGGNPDSRYFRSGLELAGMWALFSELPEAVQLVHVVSEVRKPGSKVCMRDPVQQIDRVAAGSAAAAARHYVHWGHLAHVQDVHGGPVPESLARAGYMGLLRQIHGLSGVDDAGKPCESARVAAAYSMEDQVRMFGGYWADRYLKPTRMSKLSAMQLPWAGKKSERADRCMSSGHLEGYSQVLGIPEAAVLAPFELARIKRSYPSVSVRRMPTVEGASVSPLKMGVSAPTAGVCQTAGRVMPKYFSGWKEAHTLCLFSQCLAFLDGRHATGTPPLVIVSGPTGCGKTQTPKIVCEALGRPYGKVASLNPDDMKRDIGLQLQEGAGIIHLDEIGHRQGCSWVVVGELLNLDGRLYRFRALYANEVGIPFYAAIVATGTTIPPAWTANELNRRAVRICLPSLPTGVDWREKMPGGDLANMMQIPELREAMRVIVSSAWHSLKEAGPGSWHKLALRAGALRIKDSDGGLFSEDRHDVYRELYQIYRELPGAMLREEHGSRRRTWVDIDTDNPVWGGARKPHTAKRLILHLLDFEAEEWPPARSDLVELRSRCNEIERNPLNEILGLPDGTPDLHLCFHSRKSGKPRSWKFRYKGVPNNRLPGREDLPKSKSPKDAPQSWPSVSDDELWGSPSAGSSADGLFDF